MMTRTMSVVWVVLMAMACSGSLPSVCVGEEAGHSMKPMDQAKFDQWLDRWGKHIVADANRSRYCDKSMGEDIGWFMTPYLDGFYYGYMATEDPKWVAMLVDWADSWIARGVVEPDGYVGWPTLGAAGTWVDQLNDYDADSILGEAMCLRAVVLMAGEINKSPRLKKKYGRKAASYIKLSEQVYEKWDKRGGWRNTEGGGSVPVVLPFGIDRSTGKWTKGYETRNEPGNGFSLPNNKANHITRWLLAMFDVTGKQVYRQRAEKWFRLMKSRMTPTDKGVYTIWNYWQPAGPWDYKQDGSPKHWVGVHPNAGYYSIDTEGIASAYEHGLVFTDKDIKRLVATALAEERYWSALVPYSREIQKRFEEKHDPASWGGLSATPRYLALQARLRAASK